MEEVEETPNFNDVSSEVVGFESTWKTERSVNQISSSIQTNPPPEKKDTSTSTLSKVDVATQTEISHSSINEPLNDNKLAEWLRRIYPLVAEELNAGITPVYDWESNEVEKIKVQKSHLHRSVSSTISVTRSGGPNEPEDDRLLKMSLTNSSVAWLSIKTENAPVIAVSIYPNHSSWCDHSTSTVVLFAPVQSSTGPITYSEFKQIPVKSCILHLATNPFNKDMFAGSSASGDLYIWLYDPSTNDVQELLCESYRQGTIVGMAWIKLNNLTNEYGLLTCHGDGFVILWKVGKQITQEKLFKVTSRTHKNDNNVTLSTIIGLSGAEFVVGSEDGNLFLCSASQLLPLRGKTNVFDPVISEFESHKFRITSLFKGTMDNKQMMASCDLSGEIFIHDVGKLMEDGNSIVIKMPLPYKSQIVCSRDLKYVFGPGINGELEFLKISNGAMVRIEGNGLSGKGNMISVSDNGGWIVCGTYEGELQLYKIDIE